MLKLQVGDKGEEIAVDDYVQRRGRFGEKGRFGRNDGEGRGFGRGDGRRRFSREDGTAEDSVVVTETAGTTTIPFPARTEDTAETRTARTEENGAAATKRQRTVNTPGTERREK